MHKPGPGMHNRNTQKAMEHYSVNLGVQASCSCLLHKTTSGAGTMLPSTDFNRNSNGLQSMCREGKTLIDAIKHQLWRGIHVVLLDAMEQGTFDTPAWRTLIALPSLDNTALAIITKLRLDPAVQRFEHSLAANTTTLTLYLQASQAFEKTLTLKNLRAYKQGFEDAATARAAWNTLLDTLKELTDIEKLRGHNARFNALLQADPHDYVVAESSEKGTFQPAHLFARNWSKMNTLYIRNSDGTVSDSGMRGPFHNTVVKGRSGACGDRLVRFLTEMRPNEGTKEMSAFLQKHRTEGMHADHIIPLALGGSHTRSNIAFITALDNFEKGDSLTYEAYVQVVSEPKGWTKLNLESYVVLRDLYEHIGLDKERFFQERHHIENEMRHAVESRIAKFQAGDDAQKRAFLSSVRPDLNATQQTRFMERFMRKCPQ